MAVVNFEQEKAKRLDYTKICSGLLENLLGVFLGAEEKDHEGLLTSFMEGLDLGSKPITHFLHTYQSSSNAQKMMKTVLGGVSLDVLSNVVDFIEICFPQEKNLVHKMKVVLIGFSIGKLNFHRSPFLEISVQDYLLGYYPELEEEILSPLSNILHFPKAPAHH